MIKFDPSRVTFDFVQLKTVSIALGGSLTYIDDHNQSHRLAVPFAIARSFSQRYKVTKYLKPVVTCVVKYDGEVIALERHPLASLGKLVDDGVFGELQWTPECVARFAAVKKAVADGRQWQFDGRYAYKLTSDDPQAAIRDGHALNAGGTFIKLQADAIDLYGLTATTEMSSQRACIAFVADHRNFAISPPIWKDLNVAVVDDDDDDDSSDSTAAKSDFNTIDANYCVNLNFALRAAKEVGGLSGYEAIEPLNIPELMTELCTVNLPNVPKQIKATYEIGMLPSHAVAWVLGKSREVNSLQSLIVVRSLLKYLMTKGMFKRESLSAKTVFVDGAGVNDIPAVPLKDLRKPVDLQTVVD